MSWKKTDLERLKAASITDRLNKTAPPARYGRESAVLSRREQRKRDQARGLVPFAVKLDQELVRRIQERARGRQAPVNEVVAELLEKALEDGGTTS